MVAMDCGQHYSEELGVEIVRTNFVIDKSSPVFQRGPLTTRLKS